MRDFDNWLFNLNGFKKIYIKVCIESVAQQFDLSRIPNPISDEDLDYLLTCGSVFGHSNISYCQDAALRISQYVLANPRPFINADRAALILDSLVNNPAIKLAENRNLLLEGYTQRLPISAHFEATKRQIENTIILDDDTSIQANKFQAKLWASFEDSKWTSVSAPTSAGKSFILEAWIRNYLINKNNKFVVYLVPTRALISQVEKDLNEILNIGNIKKVNVGSIPLQRSYKAEFSNVFVFTQERLHIFLSSFAIPPKIDVLVVDEAHKIGDDYRGVFLQQVIEQVSLLNSGIKVIYASPFTSNPEILLENHPSSERKSFKSSDVTVNQNLLWVSQASGSTKKWNVDICYSDSIHRLGQLNLENRPTHDSKRLSFVALALANSNPGNIVYVNRAADAETTAWQIYDSLPDSPADEEIQQLIELCEKTIHKKFKLNITLRRGVAFHYGNMPLLVKSEVERLFSKNKIKFLVCTSTLVEGVNMSCRNIFVRGPRKGTKTLMNAEDFWNLAGRAGRWGKEFQGNVICVDANQPDLWLNGSPPRTKSDVKISRSTDKVLNDLSTLVDYIRSEDHLALSNKYPNLEHVFSYLCISFIRFGSLENSPYLSNKPIGIISTLTQVIEEAFAQIQYPKALIELNPGISPISMQKLLDRFARQSDKPIERLILAEPSSEDALQNYTAAFTRICETTSDKLGFKSSVAAVRALLVIKWMRGLPLARLIQDRIDYFERKKLSKPESTTMRDVMKDVEETARYQAPRLLACYNSILSYYYESLGRFDLVNQIQDLSVYLEMGLNQQTQLSLAEMGLSRTSAVMLSEIISRDEMLIEDCFIWLTQNDWKSNDLPALVIKEIEMVLENFARNREILFDRN